MKVRKVGFFMDWLDNIKKIKKEKGLTNETLSELSGISIGTLNKLLSGATSDPKLSTLTALSTALGFGIDEMLTGKKPSGEVLSGDEASLLSKYRALDIGGKETVSYITDKEYKRISTENASPFSLDVPKTRVLRLFNIATSAGTGAYLSDSSYSKITVYSNKITDSADFAIKVSGDSMMPKYSSGDVLLVEKADSVEIGELGIFSLNGDSFFKKFGGDRLISLNPDYSDITFAGGDDIKCFGRVIGRLKK